MKTSNPRPAALGASRWQIIKSRFREWVGRIVNHLGLPGAVRDTEIYDELTDQRIKIRTGSFFTRISVNGRDYYFYRFTGRFDGTGKGLGCG